MNEREIFLQAIQYTDLRERSSFLRQACGGDSQLQSQVEELLSAHDRNSLFLETPAAMSGSDLGETVASDSPELADDTGEDPVLEQQAVEDTFTRYLEKSSRPGWLGRLAHYEVEQILGRGAFGIVAKAFDEKLHRVVAIKMLSPELANTSPPRKRFLREARSAAAVPHENLVGIHAVEDDPIPYLVMEYISGGTLQSLLDENGPLETSDVLTIGRQIAAGIAAAHAVNLIHRDIKPSNILLTEGPVRKAKISDFGLARAVDDASLTSSCLIAGTPLYMAPEQARGETLDHRADLFSLGSVLYQMVSGRPPFRASSTVGVLKRVCDDTPRPISDIIPGTPSWLCTIIDRLLEKDPLDRYQTAQEVADLLARCHDELRTGGIVSGVEQQPPFKTQLEDVISAKSSSTPGSEFPWLRGVAVGSAALIISLLVYFFTRPSENGPAADVLQPSPEKTPANDSAVSSDWYRWPPDAPSPARTPFDAEQAKASQESWAEHLGVPVEFTDKFGFTFRLIPPGEFLMGTSDLEIQKRMEHVENDDWWKACLLSEAPQHRVALTKPYYLSTTEVTQNQFESIMSSNPSQLAVENNPDLAGESTLLCPVEHITWQETQAFAEHLNSRVGISPSQSEKPFYRLPTEAEWEFACRGGTTTHFWTGDEVESLVDKENFGNNFTRIKEVASLAPNPFGLYDMSGNVHEYVQDRWDFRHPINANESTTVDPTGASNTALTSRVVRGGDFWWRHYHSRSSYRIGIDQEVRSDMTIGFRLAGDIESYPRAAIPKSNERAVTDFAETHGATLEELKSWLESLRGQYVPVRINLRWGTAEDLFDAVAVNDTDQGRWRVHFFDDDQGAGRDFQAMRNSHDIFWKLLFPRPDTPPPKCPGLKIWRKTDRNSSTWNVGRRDLLEAVNESRGKGWVPMSLASTESGNDQNNAYVHHELPGVGHRNFVGLTVSELRAKANEFRARNWRLHFFQLQAGTTTPKLSCVFRDNIDTHDWEMSFDLTSEQYDSQLSTRPLENWYPSCVGSYVQDDGTKYLVCWERYSEQ